MAIIYDLFKITDVTAPLLLFVYPVKAAGQSGIILQGGDTFARAMIRKRFANFALQKTLRRLRRQESLPDAMI